MKTDAGTWVVVHGVREYLCEACAEQAARLARPVAEVRPPSFDQSIFASAFYGPPPPKDGGPGCVPYTFLTGTHIDGREVRSSPVYRVRKHCPRCRTRYTGLDFRWQTDAEEARSHLCQPCADREDLHARAFWRSTLRTVPGAVLQRQCRKCGHVPRLSAKQYMPTCPNCAAALGPPPHHAMPAPRECITCRAVEYLSPNGRLLIFHGPHGSTGGQREAS